ncbi:cytochrome P450 [Xylaria cf. heliscus]|nr:cytochrome P450 [Xylaria cf. heliscus]
MSNGRSWMIGPSAAEDPQTFICLIGAVVVNSLLIIFFSCTVLGLILYILNKVERGRKLNLPGIALIPSPKSWDFRATLAEANAKYPNEPYIVPFQDPTVIIPAHCIEELKNLSDSSLSPNGNMYDRFAIRWTNSGWVGRELAHSIKYDLANEVDDFLPTIQEEIEYAAAQVLPLSDRWTSLSPQPPLTHIVGSVIGKMMVGGPLNRDKKWLSASIDHAVAVVMYSGLLRQFPSFFRPFVAGLLPQKRAVEKSKKDIKEAISAIVQENLANGGEDSETVSPESSGSGRLARWLLKRYRPDENPEFSPSLVYRDHYSLCFAAIHGPTFLFVQAIIDAASYPLYLSRVREEVDRELAQAPFEKWTRETIARLTFVDAFCKESARMNPQGLIGWLRKTHKPIALSTGHVIPPDTLIAATNPLYHPEATPWIKDPDKFRPERWMEDRTDPDPNASFRFGSASIDSLIFGYGKHACPGRPFGVAVVKAMFAYVVSKWDVKLPGGQGERPENLCMDFVVVPPIAPFGDLKIEFKLRK